MFKMLGRRVGEVRMKKEMNKKWVDDLTENFEYWVHNRGEYILTPKYIKELRCVLFNPDKCDSLELPNKKLEFPNT